MAKKLEGWQRGLGPYSKEDWKIRVDTSVDQSGNPKEKPRELDRDKLESGRVSGKGSAPLPKNAWK
jgi:hypothetical protein